MTPEIFAIDESPPEEVFEKGLPQHFGFHLVKAGYLFEGFCVHVGD